MYPYNKEKEDSMLMENYTAELLNLEDVIITNVENISDQLHIYVELPRTKHICPCCGAETDPVHGYRIQIVKECSSRQRYLSASA